MDRWLVVFDWNRIAQGVRLSSMRGPSLVERPTFVRIPAQLARIARNSRQKTRLQ